MPNIYLVHYNEVLSTRFLNTILVSYVTPNGLQGEYLIYY